MKIYLLLINCLNIFLFIVGLSYLLSYKGRLEGNFFLNIYFILELESRKKLDL